MIKLRPLGFFLLLSFFLPGIFYTRSLFAEEALTVRVGTPQVVPAHDPALDLPRKETGWWLPESLSPVADQIDSLFGIILILTAVLFFGTQGTLIYFLFRYRKKKNGKALYTEGNVRLEIIWTLVPLAIVTWLAFLSQNLWSQVKTLPTDTPDTVHVRIQAEQFAWNVQYPGRDGKWDTVDDILSINQLNIPAETPVRVTLTSVEKPDKPAVVHSFFLPEFRLKQDVVPGMAIDVWFKARRTGKYEIACSEFCGLGHYRMRGFLNIYSTQGFKNWLDSKAAV